MVFPTIEAFDGHSPQPEEHNIVTLFSEKRDRGLNVLTASPHSGSVCQPRMVPYTPENSYVGQGQHQRVHHPCNAILTQLRILANEMLPTTLAH